MGKYIPTRWKAWIAFAGAVVTGLVTLLADPNVQAVLPHAWQPYVALATGSVVTGALAWLKRNQLTADQVDHAVANGHVSTADVTNIVARHSTQVVNDVGAKTTADLQAAPTEAPECPPGCVSDEPPEEVAQHHLAQDFPPEKQKAPAKKKPPHVSKTPPDEGVPSTPHQSPLG